MRKTRLSSFIAGLMLLGTACHAGDIADKAAQAEQLAAGGNYLDAMTALEEAQDLLWAKAPLSFRRTLFTAGTPVGYGIYDLRENSTFKRAEPLTIYAEPMGYGYGRDGSIYIIDLALDFQIRDSAGAVVAEQKGFGNLSLRTRFPNKEFMAKVTYDFSGLPAGDYEVTTTAHDQATSKSGSFTLPFKLVD